MQRRDTQGHGCLSMLSGFGKTTAIAVRGVMSLDALFSQGNSVQQFGPVISEKIVCRAGHIDILLFAWFERRLELQYSTALPHARDPKLSLCHGMFGTQCRASHPPITAWRNLSSLPLKICGRTQQGDALVHHGLADPEVVLDPPLHAGRFGEGLGFHARAGLGQKRL